MVWISDRCFIICELPPLGMPAVLARSIPTRTVYLADSSRSRIWRQIRSITRSGEVFDVSMLTGSPYDHTAAVSAQFMAPASLSGDTLSIDCRYCEAAAVYTSEA
jgi:hypothetical protein